MKPFMKAVGGKRWLVEKLVPEIQAIDPVLYVEPFVGGGAIALALSPNVPKMIADRNRAVAATWTAIKHSKAEDLLRALLALEKAFPNTENGYKAARIALNIELGAARPLPESPRLAALTLFISARSYNGLWRTNSDGEFNAPWGHGQNPRRYTLDELKAYQELLRDVDVSSDDFRVTLKAALERCPRDRRRRMAVYVDPPYDGTFTSYTADKFDEIDQGDLARWLLYLDELGVRFWATNADTPRIRDLYAWAHIETITEFHRVGAKGPARRKQGCLLIRNPVRTAA